MKKKLSHALPLIAALLLCAANVRAEDTDIFSGASANGAAPNILIVLDNTSNNDAAWANACPYPALAGPKLLDMVYCSVYATLEAIKTNGLLGKLNVGLMVNGSGSNKGGEFFFPNSSPFNLPLMDASGIATFQSLLVAGVPKANGDAKMDGNMQEVWAWLTGHSGPRSGTSYSSHVGSGSLSCQKTFLIVIGAAAKQGRPDTGVGFGSASELAAAGATAAQQVPISSSGLGLGTHTGDDNAWIDEWARYFYGTDFNTTADDTQNVTTYTIAAGGTDPDYVQILASTAKVGGGKAFVGTDYASMVQALLGIFNEVASVNTVFASVSLPISSTTQGTFDDKLYIGMFRPEGLGAPRWMGNLKQYKFGVDLTNPVKPVLFLADSADHPAIDAAGSGFISPNAISFWNRDLDPSTLPDSVGGFWTNKKSGTPPSGFDTPDGAVVEKGGAGFRLRLDNLQDDYVANPATPRNVYTCIGSSCAGGASLSTMPFATTNASLTAAALGINNAVYTQGVTNISRSSAGIVTVTLSGTPNPVISDATTVTISGSAGGQYNYNLAGKSPSASGTTVTYTLPVEYPPLPPTGTYTVTGAAAGSSNISSLTRNSTIGWFTGTAVLSDPTFNGGSTVAVGDVLNIANSVGGYYNGASVTVLTVTGGNTVTFRAAETPNALGGGGTIANANGNDSVDNSAGSPPGLVRGASCAGCAANSGKVLMVAHSGGTKKLNTNSGIPGNGTTITLSGNSPSNYNGTFTLIGTGTSCSVQYTNASGVLTTVTGTANSGSGKNTLIATFCVDLASGFSVFPATAGSGAQVSPQTAATRQNPSVTRTISAWSKTVASNCPTTANETVQATTSIAHGFSTGELVTIATANPGPNEGAYAGSGKAITVTGASTFTYSVATTPTCTDSTSGMQISYQSSAGGIAPSDLIRWTRGDNNVLGDELGPGNGVTVRPSVHGDVLHSRPAVVNYGSTGIVVFYGANDGTFRAVNGNQSGSISGVEPGGELWSFVPSEFYSKLQRLYSNSPSIHLISTPVGITPTPTQRDYFFDGATGVYQDTASGKVYLYLTAHRGGRIIYALDVSTPSNPKFMWKFGGCPNLDNNSSCPSGAPTELGQTWALPKVVKVKGYSNPVAIFGAGYYGGYKIDPSTGTGSYFGEDNEPPDTNNLMGRGIFILDAVTGAIVWQAQSGGGSNTCTGTPCQLLDMTYAIPADVTLIDRDRPADGLVDRAYAADVGGNIWRIDFEPTGGNLPANWQVTKFAALGGATADTTKRKFLFGPDVVVTKDFDIVLAGSGDREHPTYSNTITRGIVNRFYMLKDTRIGKDANSPSAWTTIVDATTDTTDTLIASTILYHVDPTTSPAGAYPSTFPANGFYVTLPNGGEKFANGPSTIGGSVYFGTNTPVAPVANSCSKGLGVARGYKIDILTGKASSIVLDSGGLPPSPVTGLVNVPVPGGGSITVPFQIGAGNPGACSGLDCTPGGGYVDKSPFGPGPVSPDIGAKRSRVYWFIEKHDAN